MARPYPVRSLTRMGVHQGRALLGPTPVPSPARAEGGRWSGTGQGQGYPLNLL